VKRIIINIVKTVSITITGIILLALIIIFLLFSGSFNNTLTRIINSQADSFIKGEINVGKIEGKLLKGLSISNLLIKDKKDTILLAGIIDLGYSLPPLLKRKLQINHLNIRDVKLNLWQDADSIWNILRLLENRDTVIEDIEPAVPFLWDIDLKSLSINNLNASVTKFDTTLMIPSGLMANLQLKLRMIRNKLYFDLENLNLLTKEPRIQVDHLRLTGDHSGDTLNIDKLELFMPQTRIYADANINLRNPESIRMNLRAPAFGFDDFRDLPVNIPLYGEPQISIIISDNQYNIDISQSGQQISLTAYIDSLDKDSGYNISSRFQKIDFSEWTRNNRLRSNISGRLNIAGRGLDFKTNNIMIIGGFPVIEFDRYEGSADFMAEKNEGSSKIKIKLNSPAIRLSGNLAADNIFTIPVWKSDIVVSDLNLTEFKGDSTLLSDIGFKMSIRGTDFDPDKMKIDFELRSDQNQIAGVEISHIGIQAGYNSGDYQLKDATILMPGVTLNMSGKGNIKGDQNIKYSVKIDDISLLHPLTGIDSLSLAGIIEGEIKGPVNKLNLEQSAKMTDIRSNDISIPDMEIITDLTLKDKIPSGNNRIELKMVSFNGTKVEKAELTSEINGLELDNFLKVNMNDSTSIEIHLLADLNGNPSLIMPSIHINYDTLIWTGKTDTIDLYPENMSVRFPSISFESDGQEIWTGGTFSLKDTMDIRLSINNLNTGLLPLTGNSDIILNGKVNSDIRLWGTGIAPLVDARINVDDILIDTIKVENAELKFNFNHNLLSASLTANGYGTRLIDLRGEIPVHFAFSDSIRPLFDDNRLLIAGEGGINTIQPFVRFMQSGIDSDGAVSYNVKISNTLKNPDITGRLNFIGGKLLYQDFGINMQNINLVSKFENTRFLLDSLTMRSGDGWLRADGLVQFSEFDSLYLEDINIRLRSEKLTITDGPQAELVLSSDLNFIGNESDASFKGKMHIDRGLIHVDVIMSQVGMVADDPKPPLLKTALESTNETKRDTLLIFEKREATKENQIFNNLKGEIDIEIPGNTWLRGKSMNMELGGNIKAILENGKTDIFGLILIRKGHYTLYGKRLVVDRGEIELTGGSQINPLLNVSASYSFRDVEKQLRKLSIDIKGRVTEPAVEFILDGTRIEEKDGISYIMFGKNLAELSGGQQSSVNYNAAEIGKSLALGQLSGLFQGALQSSLGLDIVGIEGSNNWNSGSVSLGKYITRNLFLSYSREFTLNRNNKILQPDKISLEYQIFKWLYLQAVSQNNNSGFDLIIQKKWN